MSTFAHKRGRPTAYVAAAFAVLAAIAMPAPVAAGPGHTGLPAAVPSTKSPNIIDGTVRAIYDAGPKMIAVGTFTTVQDRGSTVNVPRRYVLAFDKATGLLDKAFAPAVDAETNAVLAGPAPGTVLIAGKFTQVNGVNRPKLAVLDVADGSIVPTFASPPINGAVTDVVRAGGRYLISGSFTTVRAQPRGGLASLDAATGALDSYLTVALTEHHNYDGHPDAAKAPVGADKLAISPDGAQLVAIGNFKKAGGVVHDQVVKLDLGATAATIANWNTTAYSPRCLWQWFDSFVRDAAFAPDGSYFVIVTTGAPYPAPTTCDTAARWEANVTATNAQPTWTHYTGGDTLLSVAITEAAVYIGGHQRWANNSFGADAAGPGAVARPGIAALDPLNGLPLRWNPGRHPRGIGNTEIYPTPEGIWLGNDTPYIGNRQYRREGIAFLPMAGGYVPHPTNLAGLPGRVYQTAAAGPSTVLYRVNAGGSAVAANDGGPQWAVDTAAAPSPYHNTGGLTVYYGSAGAIGPTVPPTAPAVLFFDERYDPSTAPEMQWDFPVPAGQRVQVRLYFQSRCTCTALPGQRQFDVAIDGRQVLTRLDPTSEAGHAVGLMKSFSVTSDGNVDIDFANVVQAPMVSAIEIVKAPAGATSDLSVRTYDGATAVGPLGPLPNPDGFAWSRVNAAFWVGGTLFYSQDGSLYRRTFDGTTFGPPSLVDPYHDPLWDTIATGPSRPGQTFAGVTTSFYPELNSVTGMFYSAGRVYYTLTGQTGLFYRYFTPDSGIVGAERFAVAGATGFSDAGGMFVAGTKLYLANRNTGTLSVRDWTGGVPGSTSTVVSGPAVDGQNWKAGALFVAP